MYRQKQVIPGESLLQCVGPSDEWCLEAHLETDYTQLEPRLFFEALVNNLAYSVRGNPEIFRGVEVANEMLLEPDLWGTFEFTRLFKSRGGNYKGRLKDLYVEPNTGLFPVMSASIFNNGAAKYTHEPPPFSGNRITMARKTNYSGYAFYQQFAFHATGSANILTPKFRVTPLASLFLTVVISRMSPQYSYSRTVSLERLEQTSIRLPVNATG
jgi:hypothetical protein